MKVLLILAALAVTALAHSKDFGIKLRHDGPTVMGGKINFIAKLYEKKDLATGSFRFDWEDNTLGHHTATHTTNYPVDVWSVKYSTKDVPLPGKYVTTVTVHKQYNGVYRTVARLQIRFEIKGTSEGDKKAHSVVSQSWMDYKRNKILNSQARELERIQDPRVRSIVSHRINSINQKIPIMSMLHQTPTNNVNDIIDYKRQHILNSQQRELDHIWNPLVKPIVASRINRINSHIPIMQDSFTVPSTMHSKKTESEEPVMISLLKDETKVPVLKSAKFSIALDSINKKMEMLNEKMKILKEVQSARDVSPTFSMTLDAINNKMAKLNMKMESLKELEDSSLVGAEETAAVGRALKKKRKVPDLSSEEDLTPTFSAALDAISKKMDKINAKIEAIKMIKSSAVDSVEAASPDTLDVISKKMETINEKMKTLKEFKNSFVASVPKINEPKVDDAVSALLGTSIEDAHTATPTDDINVINKDVEILNQMIGKMNDEDDKNESTVENIPEDAISKKVEEHSKKIEELKEIENSVVDSIKEPTVKEAVVERIKEENKRVPYLASADDVTSRFSGSLDAIHERMDEITKSQKMVSDTIQDAVTRESTLKLIEEENALLESKAKELDAQLAVALDDIHKKMMELKNIETETLNEVEDPVMKENVRTKLDTQNDKVTGLLDDVPEVKYPTPLEEVSNKIGELEFAEWAAIESINDPIVREVILQNLNEHNQKIPMMLDSADDSAVIAKSVDEVHEKIKDDVENAESDTQELAIEVTTEKTSIMKEIETTLTEFLAEIKKKLTALKESEKSVVDSTPDGDKEKVKEIVEEHNKQIPTLLLPSAVEANFTKALNQLNDRISNISNVLDVVSTNITNPFVLSMLQSKMALVNYKLVSKYNTMKDNFTALLDKMATETEDTNLVPPTPKRPKLMLGSGIPIPPIADFIAAKLAAKTAPLNMLVTDPAMQQALLDKMEARNKMIQAKTDLIGSNMAMVMALIRSKVAALQSLEDAAVEDITDPEVKEEVQATIDEENKKVPLLLLPYGIETNFTKALDDFQTKINGIKDTVNVATGNISIPAIRSMVTAKFDFINQLMKNKYAQLDSNFTAIISKIQDRFANLTDKFSTPGGDLPKKVPILTKTMGPGPAFDLTQISDLLRSKMANKFAFATSAMAGIKNATVQALFLDKMNERSKNMTTIVDKLAANFTKIMESINNKTQELQDMEMLTLDSIDDPAEQAEVLEQIEVENRKIPSLTLSKRSDNKKKDDDDEEGAVKPIAFRLKLPFVVRF